MGAGSSSPAIGANAVYVLAGGSLVAISFAGDQLWSYPCGSGGRSSPAIASSGVIYVASDSWLYAINHDGTLKWRKALPGLSDASPTVGPDGSIYIGCSAGKFQAYTSAGVLRYTYTAGRAISSSAALAADGTVYFGCDDGCLYALKPDGTLKWKFTTSPVGAIQASPSVASDGSIYFGTASGYFYAVSSTGAQKWRYGGGVSTSSPAIASDGTIYFGSQDKSLYALGKVGTLKWKYTTRGPVNSSCAIDANGTIYFGSNDCSVYAANPDGTKLWEYQAGAAIASSPSVGESQSLYVLVSNGSLCRLSADTTTPTTPTVIDDGAYSTLPSTLHASWSSSDPESGIARYEYAIGTTPGGEDLVGFTDAGVATQITRTDLALANGARYYFSVRATNGAGLVSYTGVSDGIMVDYTPPATPVVIDDGQYTSSPDTLHFVFGSGDTESGIDHYDYSIGAAPGLADILGWQGAGLVREQIITGLALAHGAIYYVNVRARNHAGLSSEGCSNGITVDLTPPPPPAIDILSACLTEIRLKITASDPESGIAQTQYAVLLSPDASSAQWIDCDAGAEIVVPGPFDGLPRHAAARARNGAGLWSSATVKPIPIDSTPPTTPAVIDDGDYSTSITTLHAAWTSQDPETGIARYAYCLGTSTGQDNVVHWTTTFDTSVTLTGLALTNGARYYFSVRATNGVGLESAIGSSDGITIDITPPTLPVVTDDGDYTSVSDSLHAVLGSSDSQSGVAQYSYCIGISPGGTDVLGWTSADSNTSATAYGLSLQPGARYYFGVKARNGAGLWSAVGTSDGIEYRCGASVWPKFRCDAANAGRSGVNACLSGHINWRVQTEGYVESSAAFAGDGTVYIGSGDGRVYAIVSNGGIRWSYLTGDTIDSSPAIGSGGEVYVGSCDHNLYCLRADGRLGWKYATGGMIWSSPSIAPDGTIYFGCQDGYIYALKPDGALRWKYNAGSAVWSSPAFASDGTIYFACGNGKLYALTPQGALKWTYQTGTAADSSPTVGANGVIYFGSGDGCFYAINPNGALRWRASTGNLVDSSAAIGADGTVYVGTGGVGYSGTMRAYSPEGVELWRVSLTGGVRSSPAVDGRGNIYFGTAEGKVYALGPDGTTIWTCAAGLSVLGSPAIGPDGQVVVGSDDGGVYCFADYPQLIGHARKQPDGTRVYLPGKVVTGVFAYCVFIEEPDRTAGIRCSIGSSDLQAGAVVDALGKIVFQNGEPVLTEASLSRLGAAIHISPVCMSIKAIAGLGLGANGLLVRIAGRVTKLGAYYFVCSDGSKIVSPRGVNGIEVRTGAGDIPSLGDYAVITGVVSREVVNAVPSFVIRASSNPGLTILP